jgi:copper chaperone CopZ
MVVKKINDMNKIKIVNIKCNGCKKGITDMLGASGLRNIKVNYKNQTVEFDGDRKIGISELARLDYPQAGTKQAKSIITKAKSYETCAVGTIKDGTGSVNSRRKKFWAIVIILVFILLTTLLAIYDAITWSNGSI